MSDAKAGLNILWDTLKLSAHRASTHTTQLYNRPHDEVSLDEVERILV
jgi:hypothetical protein